MVDWFPFRMTPLAELLQNKVLCTTLLGWVVGQGLKVALAARQHRRFDVRWFLGTGGMPSAHSSGVSALTMAVGFQLGFHTAVFAVALMFALVTMFDAQGVRRAAGRQAMALNRIVDDLYQKKPVSPERLKELLGHTPVEVFVGSALGCLIALLMYRV